MRRRTSALLVAALLVAACSSSGEDDGTSGDGASGSGDVEPIASDTGTFEYEGGEANVTVDLLAVLDDTNLDGECEPIDLTPGARVVVLRTTLENPNDEEIVGASGLFAVPESGNQIGLVGERVGESGGTVKLLHRDADGEVYCPIAELEPWLDEVQEHFRLLEPPNDGTRTVPPGEVIVDHTAIAIDPEAVADFTEAQAFGPDFDAGPDAPAVPLPPG